MEEIVGLVGHEEFRAVGGAQNQCSGGAQASDDNCVFARDTSFIDQAADFAFVPGCGDGGFDGDGQTVERGVGARLCFEAARFGADSVWIEVGESVETRIETRNLRDVGFGELGDGDAAGAQQLKLLRRGTEKDVAHF